MPDRQLTFWEHEPASPASPATLAAPRAIIEPKLNSPQPKRRPVHRPVRERYDELVRAMKKQYGLRVCKWRASTSGCAWEVHYADGSVARLIESPYPTGPMSCAVFLHEVGHHAIGLETYRVRCVEEYHAWAWSLATMRAWGFNVTAAVERRVFESLAYAVRKAKRRGMRLIPPELAPFDVPRRQVRAAATSARATDSRA